VRREYVANVSHELKTPLTSIRGYVETLLHEEPGPGTRRDFLEVVHKNATRLQNIVDDLLDLSRIESGGWRPKLEAVDPAEVAHDAWGSCREPAQQRHVTFTDPAGGLLVSADPDALRQVFANLFDNALRHTPDGGTIAVRVSASPTPPSAPAPARLQGTWIHIEVSDTGTGIPRAALPRIFERFYRVEPSRSRAAGGTGLGLAIVKHLVESMGGAVHADSVLGQGTTIHLFLPAAPVT
jgi:two-component system phosphate regulon sensor histidine kinase PhoR